MPAWTDAYVSRLESRFEAIIDGLDGRIDDIRQGRSVPALDAMSIGSGRHVRASVVFFDIVGFTDRTSSDDLDALSETLYMLDCVIPMVMHVTFDYGGYVEKNTGDGIMAIVGVGETAESSTSKAISIATVALYAIDYIVNPHLRAVGIAPVEVSFGIDYGQLLLARIGTRTGTAKQERSHITAVGPTANIAFRLQEFAQPGEIAVGALVFLRSDRRASLFEHATPPDWTWTLGDKPYTAWKYKGRRNVP